ncbi:MAG: hypothetical protein RIG67_02645 [Rhodospirillales bacterium]
MPIDTQSVLKQIDIALSEWEDFCAGARHEDCSDKPETEAVKITTRLASTLDRFSPIGSLHKRQLNEIMSRSGHEYIHQRPLAGALLALRREYELGLLQSFSELIHADLFANFLEMAEHLLLQGYKDPAAVITGSILEQHLRELCLKNGVKIEENSKMKKADSLNSELSKINVYTKLDQKNVTAWLGLRNDAAHGNYKNYNEGQVRLMIDSIRDFMTRLPA